MAAVTSAMERDQADDNAAIWRVQVRGTVYGPYTGEQMRSFVGEGRIAPHSIVCSGEGEDWHRASDDVVLSRYFEPANDVSETPVLVEAVAEPAEDASGGADDDTPTDDPKAEQAQMDFSAAESAGSAKADVEDDDVYGEDSYSDTGAADARDEAAYTPYTEEPVSRDLVAAGDEEREEPEGAALSVDGTLSPQTQDGAAADECEPPEVAALRAVLADLVSAAEEVPEARERAGLTAPEPSPEVMHQASMAAEPDEDEPDMTPAPDEEPEAARFMVIAELRARSSRDFEQAMHELGLSVSVQPGVWLLSAPHTAGALRNYLVQFLGPSDTLFISDMSRNKAAWFNLGPQIESKLRQLLSV